VTCATLGPSGWPHLMPLWYVLRESGPDEPAPRLWSWTYGVSQKVRNLEREPRATLQVGAGESYEELRGVMLECEVVVHKELDVVKALAARSLLVMPPHAAPRPSPISRLRSLRWSTAKRPSALRWSSSSGVARLGITASSAASTEKRWSAQPLAAGAFGGGAREAIFHLPPSSASETVALRSFLPP